MESSTTSRGSTSPALASAQGRELVRFHALNLFFGGVQAVQRRGGAARRGRPAPGRGRGGGVRGWCGGVGVAGRAARGVAPVAAGSWGCSPASQATARVANFPTSSSSPLGHRAGGEPDAAGQRRRRVHCDGGPAPPAAPARATHSWCRRGGSQEELQGPHPRTSRCPRARVGVQLLRARPGRDRALQRQLRGAAQALRELQELVLEVAQRVCRAAAGLSLTRSAPCRWNARAPGRARRAPCA